MGTKFTRKLLSVFDRVPGGRAWGEVDKNDQEAFKEIWNRLKELVKATLETSKLETISKKFSSHPTPNGRSPSDIWLEPEMVENLKISHETYLERGQEMTLKEAASFH